MTPDVQGVQPGEKRRVTGPSGLLALPPELLGRVYDALEIEGRVRLNAALPRSHRVVSTLGTDADVDARLGLVARYMKRPRNAGKRFADLTGRLRAFAEERAYFGDPTIARLFPSDFEVKDASSMEHAPDGRPDKRKSAHALLVAAIVAGDLGAIAELAPAFAAKQVERKEDFVSAVAGGSIAVFEALYFGGFLDKLGVEVKYLGYHIVSHLNESLLAYMAGSADERIRELIAFMLRPGILRIFACPRNGIKDVSMLIRVFGERLTAEMREAILDEAMAMMSVPVASFLLATGL